MSGADESSDVTAAFLPRGREAKGLHSTITAEVGDSSRSIWTSLHSRRDPQDTCRADLLEMKEILPKKNKKITTQKGCLYSYILSAAKQATSISNGFKWLQPHEICLTCGSQIWIRSEASGNRGPCCLTCSSCRPRLVSTGGWG